jgi:multidrug efflux pump subunit AcrB
LAAKTLYEVLEVSQSAAPETIDAAYRTISARLRVRAERDREGTAILQTALEDAYRTLSSPELRKRYDARATAPRLQHVYEVDERPWIVRHAFLLIALAVAAVAAYAYQGHVKEQRAAAEKALQAKEELVARQKAEQEEAARQQAEAARLRQEKMEEAKYQQWMNQTRRESAAYSRQQDAYIRQQTVRAEQEAARQRRMEEMEKQREEAQARARLEQEKRRLQQLEQQNYGYRRY